MSRIPRDHLCSIATLFYQNENGAVLAGATSFLLQHNDYIGGKSHIYLVTCVHCKGAKKVIFSTGEELDLVDPIWKEDPTGHDVMAMDVTDILPPKMQELNFPNLSDHVRSHFQEHHQSDVGDEIYMLGLHTAEQLPSAAAPRARFGNISAWANNQAPVRQGNNALKPSHIGDMRSRGGFSGSPVFTFTDSFYLNQSNSPGPTLFGIHSDQFSDRIKIEADKLSYANVPSSMTVIVPAWTLNFILEDPDFKSQRELRDL